MIIRFIGDVHGKFLQYQYIAENSPRGMSIQVGDFGLGFGKEPPKMDIFHRFIRGNHDSPEKCRQHLNWIEDGHYTEAFGGILYVGGAYSIDSYRRTEGVDWWRDEELDISKMNDILDSVKKTPRIIVTHDCPASMAPHLMSNVRHMDNSRTQQFLDALYEKVQPDLWIFGH